MDSWFSEGFREMYTTVPTDQKTIGPGSDGPENYRSRLGQGLMPPPFGRSCVLELSFIPVVFWVLVESKLASCANRSSGCSVMGKYREDLSVFLVARLLPLTTMPKNFCSASLGSASQSQFTELVPRLFALRAGPLTRATKADTRSKSPGLVFRFLLRRCCWLGPADIR